LKTINVLSRAMNIAASGVLAAMMLLTVSDVFLRYFLKTPILGTTEITENMMVCLTFFGMAWCAAQKSHLKVDLVMSRFSPRTQAAVDGATTLAGMVMVILIAWRSLLEGMAVRELHIISSLLRIPAYPFYYVIALGFFLLGLVMAAQAVDHIGKAVRG